MSFDWLEGVVLDGDEIRVLKGEALSENILSSFELIFTQLDVLHKDLFHLVYVDYSPKLRHLEFIGREDSLRLGGFWDLLIVIVMLDFIGRMMVMRVIMLMLMTMIAH